MSTIFVKSNRNDAQVVLWDRDERHPNTQGTPGEVWVDGTQTVPVEVFANEAVMKKLALGELVEVRVEAPKKAPAPAPVEKKATDTKA